MKDEKHLYKSGKEVSDSANNAEYGEREVVTHNNSSKRVDPASYIISKESSNKADCIGDYIKEMILGIRFDYLVSESTAVDH